MNVWVRCVSVGLWIAVFAAAVKTAFGPTPASLSDWAVMRDAAGFLLSSTVVLLCLLVSVLLSLKAGLSPRNTGEDAASPRWQNMFAVLTTLGLVGLATTVFPFAAFSIDGGALAIEAAVVVAGLFVLDALAPSWMRSGFSVFTLSFGLAVRAAVLIGWEHRDWPPSFQDEYAYLFQAETFLAGRTAFPSQANMDSFRQVHLLDQGVFACRYFPGTAIFLAPFVAFGSPWWSMWFAHGLTAGFSALTVRRISPRLALPTGAVLAFAPGMLSFGSALLSVGPTMAAMAVFYWLWPLATARPVPAKRNVGWMSGWAAEAAGLAMAAAFITRPLTAVGLGAPFAMVVLWRALVRRDYSLQNLLRMAAGFAVGPLLLAAFNFSVLGTVWESPYSRYTAMATPCHVYGFYNRDRGLSQRAPTVFLAYDDWAKNHTPSDAWPMVRRRVVTAVSEGLAGRFSVGLLCALFVVSLFRSSGEERVWLLSVLALAGVYAPYWFEGLFGYGYFAEAMPLLVMSSATVLGRWAAEFDRRGWWSASTALSVPFWILAVWTSPAILAIQFSAGSDLVFPRVEAKRRWDAEKAALRSEGRSLLVLVDADPKTAVHTTLVYNCPTLDGPVVRAWHDPTRMDALRHRFADRSTYILEYRGFNEPFVFRRIAGPWTDRRD